MMHGIACSFCSICGSLSIVGVKKSGEKIKNGAWIQKILSGRLSVIPDYSVAAMTALMVCMRFSASSKTIDCDDSKTSFVTSMQSIPNFS